MAQIDNLGDKANTNGFAKNPQNIGNRKPSIKNQLSHLMKKDGKIKIDAKQVISIEKDGGVVIKLPTQMQLAMKLQQWALSKKGNDSLKAIQMIMEQMDGKPKQTVAVEEFQNAPSQFEIVGNKSK